MTTYEDRVDPDLADTVSLHTGDLDILYTLYSKNNMPLTIM